MNTASAQSKLAPVLLDKVKNIILTDKDYVERLKRHYRMFKQAIKKENRKKK